MAADISPELSKLKLRALVVDDDEPMRALLRRLLQRSGITSTEYADASAALEVVGAVKPNFILTDHTMRLMDGISFVRALRHSENQAVQTIPVIMITGHADLQVVHSARDVGVNELLVKPVTERALLQRVQEIILRPRPFVSGPDYFGPCRRRRRDENYTGPERRKTVSPV